MHEAVNRCNGNVQKYVHCEAELINSMELSPMTPCSQVKTNLDYDWTARRYTQKSELFINTAVRTSHPEERENSS
jgi:hypothetical protein